MALAIGWSTAFAQDLPTVYHGSSDPLAEFDSASAIRVLPGGAVAEIGGSFATNVPQRFADLLAQAPDIHAVRLESPGGHVAAALAVAELIRTHALDTYVGRLCASACTLAFLAGRHRYLADGARLGFHQAIVPGTPAERTDPILRAAYARFAIPADFIDHVLQTPPQSIWYPSKDALRDAGFMIDPPPPSVTVTDDVVSAAWDQSRQSLRWASDATLAQLASGLAPLLGQLQSRGDAVCWQFMHGAPTELTGKVNPKTLAAITSALQQASDDVRHTPAVGIDAADRMRALTLLTKSVDPARQRDVREALRPGGTHGSYCRTMQLLLNTALAMPHAGPPLRALLTDE